MVCTATRQTSEMLFTLGGAITTKETQMIIKIKMNKKAGKLWILN